MLLIPVNEDDFCYSDPIIHALVRQRQHYPLADQFLKQYRKGIQYVTMYGAIYELRIKDFLDLRRQVPKLYYLEFQGYAQMTVSKFFEKVDYCARTYSTKHFLDDDFWNYWDKWLDQQGR